MTQRALNTLVKLWQRRLGIADWKVKAIFVEATEDMEDCAGKIFYMPEYRKAEMHVLRPQDRDEAMDPIEEDVVHELLHLCLQGHQPQRDYDAMFERGLNQVARGLLEGYSE